MASFTVKVWGAGGGGSGSVSMTITPFKHSSVKLAQGFIFKDMI